MDRSDEQPRDTGYRNPADACLARTADAIDFTSASTAAASDAAERRVDPFRRVLSGLLRGLRQGRAR